MKKLLIGLAGLVVVLVAAVVLVPRLIDLRPRLAAAVYAATGRDLRIDGPLHIALLPRLSVSARGVHFANAPGTVTPEMLSIDSVTVGARLWPLLRGRLVVDSLLIVHPVVALQRDKAGRENWTFQAPGDTTPGATTPASTGLGGVAVGAVTVERGQLSYRDDLTGQAIEARDITLAGAMPTAASPLSLRGRMTLNDAPVTAELTVDSPDKLQRGQPARVKLALDTQHLTATFDGTARQRPVPGLNGVFDLAIPSVGKLAAWLKRPLDAAQPDPGPLAIHADFTSDGARSALKDATITGTALNLKASGSLDASGGVTKLTGVVDSGILDIDRYLPRTAPASPRPAGGPAAAVPDPFASLSDQPFALDGLRRLDADIKVSIAGIKAMGYQVGHIGFTATAKAGVLSAALADVALYGGTAKGTLRLDAAGKALGLDVAASVDHVDAGKLAQIAASGAPPVSGAVSATLAAKAEGTSPRALAGDLRGRLMVDLGGVAVKGAGTQGLSRLTLALDLPGGDKAPGLVASAVYKGERIDATASLAPLRVLASGARFPARLAVDSNVAKLRFGGTVQQKPAAGLDGSVDLDVPSLARLAAWAGSPLAPAQPDPGPVQLHATLVAAGSTLDLKSATITGKALKATAQGRFDGSRRPANFDAKVDIQQANLNAYLPPREASSPAGPSRSGPAGWSTESFDVSALGDANGKADVTLHAVTYRDLDITGGDVRIALASRVLTVTTGKLTLAQGSLDSTLKLDATGAVPKLDAHVVVAGMQARPLLQSFAGSDRLGGTIALETTVRGAGRNQKELVSSLDGTGTFRVTDGTIYGINLAQILRKAGTLGFGASPAETTDFAELAGTYTIRAGVIDNRDMRMLAPLFRLTGAGTVPMPAQTVDYAAEAKLVPTIQGQGGTDALAGVPIPIRVTGPWSNPAYRIDWAGVFRSIAADPARLKALPGDLGKAAQGFGVLLPGSGGVTGGVTGGTGGGTGGGTAADILKAIPGLPQSGAPGPQPATPAFPLQLPKNLFGK